MIMAGHLQSAAICARDDIYIAGGLLVTPVFLLHSAARKK
jgi:hypothetical protein